MIDKNIAQSETLALNRHLWYLTAEIVPLALFSHDVPEMERRALADALLDVKQPTLQTPLNRLGAGWGKPKFPSVTISMRTRLCELDGVDSWFTIHLLQLDVSLLHLPVSEWESDAAYIASAANVAAVNVANDGTERGIKLSTDFLDAARSDEHFQNVLQVVEQDCQQCQTSDRHATPYVKLNSEHASH